LTPDTPKFSPDPPWLSPARLIWVLLTALTLALFIVQIPLNINAIYNDWQVTNSAPATQSVLPFTSYALYVLVLRYLVTLLFFVVALLVFTEVGRLKGRYAGMGLFVSLMLVLLPQVFILGVANVKWPYPAPWDRLFGFAGEAIVILGMLCFLAFYYIFPDGKFLPGWMRWIALALGAGLAVLFISMFTNSAPGEWVWMAGVLALLASLSIAIAGQVYRYRVASREQRRQTRWVDISLVSLPLWVLLGFVLGSSPLAELARLHLNLLILALLPVSIALAILRRGLWDAQVSASHIHAYAALAGVLTILWSGGLVIYNSSLSNAEAASLDITQLEPSSHPRLVVIDTDMAVDDWMAILYLLQRPDIKVLAITVVGTGEAHCEPGVRNALGLVALAGKSGIPVACGRDTPLQGNHVFPEAWRQGVDSLYGLNLPEGSNPASGQSAVELLPSTIQSAPEKVYLLTLGPLTNLAEALQNDPTFTENLDRIFIMGGALQVPGNVGNSDPSIDNQAAEWNFYIDPLAAKIVLESGAPITLVTLDSTNQVPLDSAFYRQLSAHHNSPEADFYYDLLTQNMDMVTISGTSFWDTLTASILADQSLVSFMFRPIQVVTDAGSQEGATRLAQSGAFIRIPVTVERERFIRDFLNTLNQK
jgi:inosine-uridine nucleoside N-ribohydrolase